MAPHIMNLALHSPPVAVGKNSLPAQVMHSYAGVKSSQVSSSPRKPCGSEAAGVEGASILIEADFVAKVFRLFFMADETF